MYNKIYAEEKSAYYEDTDLSFEVRNHGYRVLYQPFARVMHYESMTLGGNTEKPVNGNDGNNPFDYYSFTSFGSLRDTNYNHFSHHNSEVKKL